MSAKSQYDQGILDSMQEIFGQGFLSPGGPAEVAGACDGVDLNGKSVLDWGCGLGGTSLALARACGAGQVLGLDVEPNSLALARDLAGREGLQDRVSFKLVEPGPLPLEEGSFDALFTKAALCHVSDKAAVLAEYHRVLVPGGKAIISDWMTGHPPPFGPEFETWAKLLAEAGLVFHFADPQAHETALRRAGFVDLQLRDGSAAALGYNRADLVHIRDKGRARLTAALGPRGYAAFLARTEARALALEEGDLKLVHIQAQKPRT